MNSIATFTKDTIRYLTGYFPDTDIVPAYEPVPKQYPLPRPAIAVGVEAVDLGRAALGGYLGAQDGEALYGGQAEITLRLDLYVPQTDGAAALHRLYERLCDALLLAESTPAGFERLWCERTGHDKSSAAMHLPAYGRARAALVREERAQDACIEDVRLVVNA